MNTTSHATSHKLGLLVLAHILLVPISVHGDTSFDVLVLRLDGVQVRFEVELAADAQARQLGLMNRKKLPSSAGMLFDFERPTQVRMWMKNTLLALDMLFVDERGSIKHIEHNAQPHTTRLRGTRGLIRYVLEINGGEARHFGIQANDRLILLN